MTRSGKPFENLPGVRRLDAGEQGDPPEGVNEKRVTPLFSGGRTGPDAGAWIFYVGLWTPKEWRSEFCAWYRCEHAEILLECPDWEGFQFLEGPSVRDLSGFLADKLAPAEVTATPPTAPAAFDPDAADLLARIDTLSDDQVDALLQDLYAADKGD